MIAAGGPAGKTRATRAGTGTERPAPSVTLAARAERGARSDAESPARSRRRSSFIPLSDLRSGRRSSHAGGVRAPGGRLPPTLGLPGVADRGRLTESAKARRPREIELSPGKPWLYCASRGETRSGGMAEWLKAHAWKACIRETVSWVRIPLPPPVCPRPTFSAGFRVRIEAQ